MTGETTFRAKGFHKSGRQNKSNEGLCFDTNHFGAEMMCHSPAMNMTGLGDIITPTFQLGDENAGFKNGQQRRNRGKNPFSPIQESENTSCFYEYASALGGKSNKAETSMFSDQPWDYYSNSKFNKNLAKIDENKYSTHDPSLKAFKSPRTAFQQVQNTKEQFKSNDRSCESMLRSVSKTDTSFGSKLSKTGTGKKKKGRKNTA